MIHTPIPLTLPAAYTQNIAAEDALALAIFGNEGSGKTKFMISAPDPIGIVALDRKTRRTVEMSAKATGKRVIMPKEDMIRVENPLWLSTVQPDCTKAVAIPLDKPIPAPKCCAKHYYRWHVNRVKRALFDMYNMPYVRSLGIDTGSQLWEDILFAHFGRADRIMPRDRGPANQEMIDLLNYLSGKHLIITHKSKEIWKNDKPTGKFERAGFAHVGYHVNAVIEFCSDTSKRMEGDELYDADRDAGRFYINVAKCQSRPQIEGVAGAKLLIDDQINFQYLAYSIFPDVDPTVWG